MNFSTNNLNHPSGLSNIPPNYSPNYFPSGFSNIPPSYSPNYSFYPHQNYFSPIPFFGTQNATDSSYLIYPSNEYCCCCQAYETYKRQLLETKFKNSPNPMNANELNEQSNGTTENAQDNFYEIDFRKMVEEGGEEEYEFVLTQEAFELFSKGEKKRKSLSPN